MCKIKVAVSVSSQQEADRAVAKLGKIPNIDKTSIQHKGKEVIAIIDHPDTLTNLQAAAFAKDSFGMEMSLSPSALVLT